MSTRPVMMRRLRETALWLGAVLGVLCLLLAALAWIFDIRPLVFKSGSMSPEIEAGAVALAREVPAEDVAIDDVVSVVNDEGVRVTHRVVSVDEVGGQVILKLKGDANSTPDKETYAVDDVYRVFADVPLAGHVVNATSSPWGLLMCGGFVTFLLISAFGGRREDDDGDDAAVGSGTDGKPTVSRSAAGIAAAGMIAAAMVPMGTMATFSDTANVASGPLNALTVPAPTNPRCGTGVNATISWTSAGPNYSYYVTATQVSTGRVTYQGVQSGTSITFTTGLLGNLTSSNFVARIRAVPTGANAWQSTGSVTSNFRTRTLGLGTTCGHV